MRRILNLIQMDFKLIIRDKIALYMALAPVLLSLIMLMVIGNMSEGTLSLAVTTDVPQSVINSLERVADIEMMENYSSLKRRVGGADSIAGVYMDNGSISILVEGNEKEGFAEKNLLLIQRALSHKTPDYESVQVEATGNIVLTITISSLILLAMVLGGALSGFNIVNERENGAIRALAVSPTHLVTYTISRTLSAMILGIVNVILSAAVMGMGNRYWYFAIIALSSLFVYGLIALSLGMAANNQISAIAVMKLLMPLCLLAPITSSFVPESFQFLYYPLPMYWQYNSILAAIEGNLDLLPLLMILITGFIWFIVALVLSHKAIGLRMRKEVGVCSGIGGC